MKLLTENSKLGVISPGWWVEEELLKKGAAHLESLGFEVFLHPQNFLKWGQIAGTVQERCIAFYELLEDKSIDAIVFGRVAYGSLQLLDALDYGRIQNANKPIIGYSDATALLNAIYAKAAFPTFHGPVVKDFAEKPNEITDASFLATLRDGVKKWDFSTYEGDVRLLQDGEGSGILLGGNMTVFDQLIGTPYMPSATDVVLLLEEFSNEKINELDKKLLHLKHCGFLKNVRGLILAGMRELSDNKVPFGFNVSEIVSRYLPSNVPVVSNTPCGHGESILTLPIGAKVRLNGMKLSVI